MRIKAFASLVLILCIVLICNEKGNAQDESISSPFNFGNPSGACSECRPFGIGVNHELNCACWYTPFNTYCHGSIWKKVRFKIQFPDGTEERVGDLSATGQVDMGESCQGGCSIGPPYLLRECWPQFYQPLIGRGYLRAVAQGAKAVPMLDPIGCCSRGICVPYIWNYACESSGVETEIEFEHECAYCFGT